MNRRKVLKTLAGLGASSAFSAAAITKMAAPADRSTETSPAHMTEGHLEADTVSGMPRIGIIGVGRAGGAILSDLYTKLHYVDRSIAIDLVSGNLRYVKADQKILIEAKPSVDNSSKALFGEAVAGLDLAFIVVALGGVTETSLSAQVAEVLKERQVSTIAAAITPSDLTSPRCKEFARTGLQLLRQRTVATVPIALGGIAPILTAGSRDRLILPLIAHPVEHLVRGITAQLVESNFVGLNMDDLRLLMAGAGYAAIGYGSARGKNAATAATLEAINHPLLGPDRLSTASGILILVETSGASFYMQDAIKIYSPIRNVLADFFDGYLGFGAIRTESMAKDFRVTILASEMPDANAEPRRRTGPVAGNRLFGNYSSFI